MNRRDTCFYSILRHVNYFMWIIGSLDATPTFKPFDNPIREIQFERTTYSKRLIISTPYFSWKAGIALKSIKDETEYVLRTPFPLICLFIYKMISFQSVIIAAYVSCTLAASYHWPSPQYDALEALLYEGKSPSGFNAGNLGNNCVTRNTGRAPPTKSSIAAEWVRLVSRIFQRLPNVAFRHIHHSSYLRRPIMIWLRTI